MKKEYINPQTIVVSVQMQAILEGSEYVPFAETEEKLDGSQAASRKNYSIWGDDE